MPAIRIKCSGCGRKFWASRVDSKWCSEKCRYKERNENAKFRYPTIPQSGIPYVTFNRYRTRWEVRIPEGPRGKYVGGFKTLEQAKSFHRELQGA